MKSLREYINESMINESTRAQIGIIDKKGKITSVYLHWGDESGVINKLNYYNSTEKVKELLDLGKYGISDLGKYCGTTKQNFYTPEDKNSCIFYGRDRGERDNSETNGNINNLDTYIRKAKNDGAEYIYLWDESDNKWKYANINRTKELKIL